MTIHKEGIKILIREMLIFSIVNYLSYNYAHDYFSYFVTILTSFIFLMSVYFFRIPNRILERKENVIYSPCDGKVVIIEEVEDVKTISSEEQDIDQ